MELIGGAQILGFDIWEIRAITTENVWRVEDRVPGFCDGHFPTGGYSNFQNLGDLYGANRWRADFGDSLWS